MLFKIYQAARELQEYLIVVSCGKLIAALLYTLNMKKEAQEILEFLRDLCEDTYNFTPLLDIYDRMAEMLKQLTEYDKACVAAKKMLQLAWIIGSKTYELKAFKHLGLNYFYK